MTFVHKPPKLGGEKSDLRTQPGRNLSRTQSKPDKRHPTQHKPVLCYQTTSLSREEGSLLWKAYVLEVSIEEAKKQEMRLRRPALHWHLKSGWEKIAANHVLIFLSYVWQIFLVIKRNMICSMSYVNWKPIRYECPIFFWSISCMNDGQRGILQSLDLRLFLQFEAQAAITEYIQLALHTSSILFI